jgi:hypothetical protein
MEGDDRIRSRRSPEIRGGPAGRAPVRRRGGRLAEEQAAPRALPALEELRGPAGRAALEGIVRRRGARPAAVLRELAAGWRRPDGQAPTELDLRDLLEAHGLARPFARRERADALHALRVAGGVKALAAGSLEMGVASLDELLARTGAAGEAEAIRQERRAALRRRGTLAERARLVLEESSRLQDLGLLAEFEADLRSRLPDHLRALRAAGAGPLDAALARSLGLPRAPARALALRLGADLGPGEARRRPGGRGPALRRA